MANNNNQISSQARFSLTLGAALGFLGVALGAFGAHALKAKLGPDLLTIFETGVRYQMYHALALLLLGVLGLHWPEQKRLKWVTGTFALGILIFSGSLYMLALTGVRLWGAVTPLGGLCFLLGWTLLALTALKAQN